MKFNDLTALVTLLLYIFSSTQVLSQDFENLDSFNESTHEEEATLRPSKITNQEKENKNEKERTALVPYKDPNTKISKQNQFENNLGNQGPVSEYPIRGLKEGQTVYDVLGSRYNASLAELEMDYRMIQHKQAQEIIEFINKLESGELSQSEYDKKMKKHLKKAAVRDSAFRFLTYDKHLGRLNDLRVAETGGQSEEEFKFKQRPNTPEDIEARAKSNLPVRMQDTPEYQRMEMFKNDPVELSEAVRKALLHRPTYKGEYNKTIWKQERAKQIKSFLRSSPRMAMGNLQGTMKFLALEFVYSCTKSLILSNNIFCDDSWLALQDPGTYMSFSVFTGFMPIGSAAWRLAFSNLASRIKVVSPFLGKGLNKMTHFAGTAGMITGSLASHVFSTIWYDQYIKNIHRAPDIEDPRQRADYEAKNWDAFWTNFGSEEWWHQFAPGALSLIGAGALSHKSLSLGANFFKGMATAPKETAKIKQTLWNRVKSIVSRNVNKAKIFIKKTPKRLARFAKLGRISGGAVSLLSFFFWNDLISIPVLIKYNMAIRSFKITNKIDYLKQLFNRSVPDKKITNKELNEMMEMRLKGIGSDALLPGIETPKYFAESVKLISQDWVNLRNAIMTKANTKIQEYHNHMAKIDDVVLKFTMYYKWILEEGMDLKSENWAQNEGDWRLYKTKFHNIKEHFGGSYKKEVSEEIRKVLNGLACGPPIEKAINIRGYKSKMAYEIPLFFESVIDKPVFLGKLYKVKGTEEIEEIIKKIDAESYTGKVPLFHIAKNEYSTFDKKREFLGNLQATLQTMEEALPVKLLRVLPFNPLNIDWGFACNKEFDKPKIVKKGYICPVSMTKYKRVIKKDSIVYNKKHCGNLLEKYRYSKILDIIDTIKYAKTAKETDSSYNAELAKEGKKYLFDLNKSLIYLHKVGYLLKLQMMKEYEKVIREELYESYTGENVYVDANDNLKKSPLDFSPQILSQDEKNLLEEEACKHYKTPEKFVGSSRTLSRCRRILYTKPEPDTMFNIFNEDGTLNTVHYVQENLEREMRFWVELRYKISTRLLKRYIKGFENLDKDGFKGALQSPYGVPTKGLIELVGKTFYKKDCPVKLDQDSNKIIVTRNSETDADTCESLIEDFKDQRDSEDYANREIKTLKKLSNIIDFENYKLSEDKARKILTKFNSKKEVFELISPVQKQMIYTYQQQKMTEVIVESLKIPTYEKRAYMAKINKGSLMPADWEQEVESYKSQIAMPNNMNMDPMIDDIEALKESIYGEQKSEQTE